MSSPISSLYFNTNNCPLDTIESGGDIGLAYIQCISNEFTRLDETISLYHIQTTNWLLIYAGALVFFMQAGFAMLVGGSVRKKNLQNTMLKNLLDCCGAAVAFWSIGYGLAYGGDGTYEGISFAGNDNFFGTGLGDGYTFAFWFFQLSFCAAAVTIVAGTLAERCQMGAYLGYSIILTGIVYPIVVHTFWSAHGKFSPFVQPLENRYRGVGCIDFAGSGIVHVTGGTVALIAAIILGPRVGRFYDPRTGHVLEQPKHFPGHSIPLQVLGTLILWFGFYGFNPGSALALSDSTNVGTVAARAAANTTIAAGTGTLSAMILNLLRNLIPKTADNSNSKTIMNSTTHHDNSNNSNINNGNLDYTILTSSNNTNQNMNNNTNTDLGVTVTCTTNSSSYNKPALQQQKQQQRRFVYSFNLLVSMNGCLSGLVAVTAGSGVLELWSSCVVGLIAGILYVYGSELLIYYKIDDAVDAIPVHMFNGMWGVLAVGIFASPTGIRDAFGMDNTHFGWVYNWNDMILFSNQIIEICVIVFWSAIAMTPFFLFLNYMGWFRSDGLEEVVGLDVRYHGGTQDVDEAEMIQDIETFRNMILNNPNGNTNNSQVGQVSVSPLPAAAVTTTQATPS